MSQFPSVAYVLLPGAGAGKSAPRQAMLAALQTISPAVDMDARDEHGRFWVDCRGLARIYVDDAQARPGTALARALWQVLQPFGEHVVLVLGFSRFNTYCLASAAPPNNQTRRAIMLESPQAEATRAAQTPLAALGVVLSPTLRRELLRLGVDTVGQLARLPAGGLLERYGRDLHRIHQLARQDIYDPLVAAPTVETRREREDFEDSVAGSDRLLFAAKTLLARLLPRLGARHLAVAQLHLELLLDVGVQQRRAMVLTMVPAAASLDALLLMRLVAHKLAATPLAHPVAGMALWASETAATTEQLQLFATKPRRDLSAGNDALAKLRAELGEDAVVHAVAAHGHLPESRFRWASYRTLMVPSPQAAQPVVVRRLLATPVAVTAPTQAPMARPFRIAGGWWAKEVVRQYCYVATADGAWQWLYYDHQRGAWFCQGSVQ